MPSNLKFKAGVIVPKVVIIAAAVINAANEVSIAGDVTVTSGSDPGHMPGSKHYTNEALDIRSKTVPTAQKRQWLAVIKRRLGRDYDCILEYEGKPQEHFHIEYDPK